MNEITQEITKHEKRTENRNRTHKDMKEDPECQEENQESLGLVKKFEKRVIQSGQAWWTAG